MRTPLLFVTLPVLALLAGCQTSEALRVDDVRPSAQPLADARPAPEAPSALAPSADFAPGAASGTSDGQNPQPTDPDYRTDRDDTRVEPAAARQGTDGRYRPHEGQWEVSLGATGTNDNDFDAGTASATVNVGYYLTDNWQVSLRQNANFADSDVSDSVWNFATRGALDYHFGEGPWVPFIGANLGYVYGDAVQETWIAAPEGGVKWFLKPEAFFYLLAEYQFFFDDNEDIDEGFDDGAFVYSVGAGMTF